MTSPDLIDRLEKAEGGSRELSFAVLRLLGHLPADAPERGDLWWHPGEPHETVSIDAALALAERVLGELRSLCLLEDVAQAALDDDRIGLKDLPRFLCIALLKARASSEGEGEK